MYSIDWNGHRISWELTCSRVLFFPSVSMELFVDDQLVGNSQKGFNVLETVTGKVEYDGEEVIVELYKRTGLFGLLTQLKIDGEKVKTKFVFPWQIRGVLLPLMDLYLVLFLVPLVGIIFLGLLGMSLIGLIGPTPDFSFNSLEFKELNLEKIPGKIYFADTLCNVLCYTPSSGESDTITSLTPANVVAMSPDSKSLITLESIDWSGEKYSRFNMFWQDLETGKKRLIFTSEKEIKTIKFTPDGSRIYFYSSGDSVPGYCLADTSGKLINLGNWYYLYPHPSGNYFIGQRATSNPWLLILPETGDTTLIDTSNFPPIESGQRWKVSYWNYETLFVDIIYGNDHKHHPNEGYFVPLNNKTTLKVSYPGLWLEKFGYKDPIIVAEQIVLFVKERENSLKLYIYSKDRLLWETWGWTFSYDIRSFSPDKRSFLSKKVIYKPVRQEIYKISGPNGTESIIPIDGDAKFLIWKGN